MNAQNQLNNDAAQTAENELDGDLSPSNLLAIKKNDKPIKNVSLIKQTKETEQ